jgi:hypothetical protein
MRNCKGGFLANNYGCCACHNANCPSGSIVNKVAMTDSKLTSKEKGDLLEKIIGQLCSSIKNAKTKTNIKIIGKSGTERQVDVFIKGNVGAFEVKILVDSKNHSTPIDIKEVESIAGMVEDVGADLGVIVCSSGFTEGAKKRANTSHIQLYEIYDQSLGNTELFIPLRYVTPYITRYNFSFHNTSAAGPFFIPTDQSRWQFNIDDKTLTHKEVLIYVWNKRMVPRQKGNYVVKIGAVKITDPQDKMFVQYCDLDVGVQVEEDYYLKLFPASFIRKVDEVGKEYFDLRIDAYSKKEDMLKNGWQQFETMEEMNKAADIENQPVDVRELLMREE